MTSALLERLSSIALFTATLWGSSPALASASPQVRTVHLGEVLQTSGKVLWVEHHPATTPAANSQVHLAQVRPTEVEGHLLALAPGSVHRQAESGLGVDATRGTDQDMKIGVEHVSDAQEDERWREEALGAGAPCPCGDDPLFYNPFS